MGILNHFPSMGASDAQHSPLVAGDQRPSVPVRSNAASARPVPPRTNALADSLALAVQEAFSAITYAHRSDTPVPDARPESANSGQVEFHFFTEIRHEELVRFYQRTGSVAEGATSEQRETLIEASRKVAARFEFSVTVSGALLRGFATAAERSANDNALGALIALTDKLLGLADELLQQAAALLDTFAGNDEALRAGVDNLTDAYAGQDSPGRSLRSVEIQLEFSFSFSFTIEIEQGELQESDPITFDLDGDGIELTSYRNGARFDILGSGEQVTTAFVTGGDAFLALDRNGNGLIDNGGELFGDQRGASNGFEELRILDLNGDGVIDRMDPAFEALRLFADNGDGRTDPGELISLSDAGIRRIHLSYLNVDQRAAGGNRIAQVASYERDDGSRGATADAVLTFTA